MTRSRRGFFASLLGIGGQPPLVPPSGLTACCTESRRVRNQRLFWDDIRLGWVLPVGARNVVAFHSGHYLVEKVSSGSTTAWDYEIVPHPDGDLVKPQRVPWASAWHTYFEFDLP